MGKMFDTGYNQRPVVEAGACHRRKISAAGSSPTAARLRLEQFNAMQPPLEVEQKYRVPSLAPLHQRLVAIQARRLADEEQLDLYLQHPARDFSISGEAFRLRRINGNAVITYKGPRQEGPIKVRTEIELPLAEDTDGDWLEILERLGFRRVHTIRKHRSLYLWPKAAQPLSVMLDEVDGLGFFVELEVIVDHPNQLAQAQASIQNVALELGLEVIETRSYLRQMLESKEQSASSTTKSR
jgi:adenylate cyclase class 2